VESIVYNILGPSVEEVTVKSIPSAVTARPPERLHSLSVREIVRVDVKEHLEENTGNADGVSGRAVTTIGSLDGEGHVRLMVGAVEIHTIPTHGEPHLGTQTVMARLCRSGERVLLGVVVVVGVVEAKVLDASVSNASSEIAADGASGGHSQTSGEGVEIGVILACGSGSGAAEVIDGQTSIGNEGKATVGPLVVQVGDPVVGQVHGDGAGGA
jgi:hypothetical protein